MKEIGAQSVNINGAKVTRLKMNRKTSSGGANIRWVFVSKKKKKHRECAPRRHTVQTKRFEKNYCYAISDIRKRDRYGGVKCVRFCTTITCKAPIVCRFDSYGCCIDRAESIFRAAALQKRDTTRRANTRRNDESEKLPRLEQPLKYSSRPNVRIRPSYNTRMQTSPWSVIYSIYIMLQHSLHAKK